MNHYELLEVIDERDEAQEALSQVYYIVTGRSPEWSNLFGVKEAVADITDAVTLLKKTIQGELVK